MNTINDVIQRMKQDLSALDAEIGAIHPDIRDPQTRDSKGRMLDDLFDNRIDAVRSGSKKASADEVDGWSYPVCKRRKQAILNLLEEAERRFAEKYPGLSVSDQLMLFNAPLIRNTFDALNRAYAFDLAAAIWMLDYLKANDRWEEACQYLPDSRAELDTVYLPMLSDSVHSDDELKAMLYLIRCRSRGMSGCSDSIAFGDEADIGLQNDAGEEKSKDRQNFDAVMALIDRQRIGEVQDALIGQIWEHFDHLLAAADALYRERLQKKKELRGAIAAQLSALEENRINSASVLVVQNRRELFTDDASLTGIPQEMQKGIDEINRLIAQVKTYDYRIECLCVLMLMLPEHIAGNLSEEDDMAVFSDLPIPVIRDPYDICFGYLSLLSDGSDYAWLYNLCLNIVAFACHALPWADSDVVAPEGETGGIQIDYDYLSTLIEKKPDWNDDSLTEKLYEPCIPSPLLKSRRVNTSIARLAFLSSGLIPPRSCHSLSFTRALLNETDFSPETQDMIYHYFALAYSFNHKGEEFEAPDEDQTAEDAAEENALQDKDAEIKRLRAQIKHLKSVVNQAEHQNKELSSELSNAKRKLDDSNTELAELRTMIRASCGAEEESPTVIDFPYTAQKRTVIIGGHDSWLKAIKPLLQNVRYIGPSEQPNPGVILNAEVVWIQSNAMGHSSFYKVIDIVRRNSIKVCYFKYASAEKCAEQLALEETEAAEQ